MRKLNNAEQFVLLAIIDGRQDILRIERGQYVSPAAEIIDRFLQEGLIHESITGHVYSPDFSISRDEVFNMKPWDNPMFYINHYMYSDVHPYEIIRQATKTKLFIRAMKYDERSLNKLDFHPGGFSAHCSNQHEAVYLIESDPTNPEIPVRWSEKNNCWNYRGMKFHVSDNPIYFYDFNF